MNMHFLLIMIIWECQVMSPDIRSGVTSIMQKYSGLLLQVDSQDKKLYHSSVL